MTLGGTFSGYNIAGYDRATDTLTLIRKGKESRVRLKDDAKVRNARLELTGHITFGADSKFEIERATLLFDQENVFPLTDGIVYRITPKRLEDGNIHYDIAVEHTLSENKTERIAAPSIVTLPHQPFRLQVGELGFAFTPKS